MHTSSSAGAKLRACCQLCSACSMLQVSVQIRQHAKRALWIYLLAQLCYSPRGAQQAMLQPSSYMSAA